MVAALAVQKARRDLMQFGVNDGGEPVAGALVSTTPVAQPLRDLLRDRRVLHRPDTLEEWFDANRLRQDYVPKGFHLGPGPIVGHEYGLRLSVEDKRALIAFLKTL